jgi:hypothetical protein
MWISKTVWARIASGAFYFNIALEVLAHCWMMVGAHLKDDVIALRADMETKFNEKTQENDEVVVWKDESFMQKVNLAAGIVYFIAITFNFPNHFWGRFPACRYVCEDDYPEGVLGRGLQRVFGGAKPDENAQLLYRSLCDYKIDPNEKNAMKTAAECLQKCKEKRLKLREAGPIWCSFKQPACTEQIRLAKAQAMAQKAGYYAKNADTIMTSFVKAHKPRLEEKAEKTRAEQAAKEAAAAEKEAKRMEAARIAAELEQRAREAALEADEPVI